jgi:hypothetical protein
MTGPTLLQFCGRLFFVKKIDFDLFRTCKVSFVCQISHPFGSGVTLRSPFLSAALVAPISGCGSVKAGSL